MDTRTVDESPPNTAAPTGAAAKALAGWGSRLAALVVGLLLVLAASGLWMWLARFSVTSQLLMLLHVAVGALLLVPLAIYQWRHVRAWWTQRMTAEKALGFALLGVLLVSALSGAVLTAQALLGSRLSTGWDLAHLVAGLVTTALLIAHVLMAWLRRRRSQPIGHAARGLALSGAAMLVLALMATGGAGLAWPLPAVERPVPEDYSLPSYAQAYEEYRGSPFAPTYARTASGQLVEPEVLAGSTSCGTSGCHEQILREWQPSAHRFAAMNPPFQQVQHNFAEDREPSETRYCAGCHDPISLFAGAKDIHNQDLSSPGMQEGVSCVVCHSISAVDQRGNADYVLTPPKEYLWTGDDGARKAVSDFLIRAYPRQHLADYDRALLRSPEYCGVCHKQFIPEALNRFGVSAGQNQYDEWRQSHWHSDDPQSNLSCQDCHMRLVTDSTDPGRGEAGAVRRTHDDGAHRHHGTIGTNFLMPQVMRLPNWQEQVRLTKEWIQGETVLPEIADLWPEGPVAAIDLRGPDRVGPNQEAALRVIVTNRKAGHNFTTGPLDFMQAWVHIVVTDARGAKLLERGALDPVTRWITDRPGQAHESGNPRDEGTMVFEGMPLDENGLTLLEHQLWRKAGGKGMRIVFPRHSDTHVFRFTIPPDAVGPLHVRADLNFRRYRQQFLDHVVPDMERESGVRQPHVLQSTASKVIALEGVSLRRGPSGQQGEAP